MTAQLPPGLYNAIDYERLAMQQLEPGRLAYIAGGCGWDASVAANRAAFARWAILPRLLRDLQAGHGRLQLAGQAFEHPFFLAPVAHQRLVHAEAECASARAAEATGSTLVASTLSSCPLEDIASANGPGRRWFQLYLQPERGHSLQLLRRAEAAGYQAIVLTLDASIQLASRSALQAGFVMPADCTPANLAGFAAPPAPRLAEGESRIFQAAMRHAPSWDDLHWLLASTRLPVWVKGVLHPEDACQLQGAGATGLIVSNHGGRSLDGAPASLDMLAAVRAAVGPGYPLLFDGGIRSGQDAFKALALGADALLIGRLQVYALAVAGALGVAHLLQLLVQELHACMAQAGCARLADITPDCLWKVATC